MKTLIADDDRTSRKFLFQTLSRFGECDMVVDGLEAIDAVILAIKDQEPYELICLDIMMPKVDGVKVLESIRDIEKRYGILPENQAKIIMTTALALTDYVQKSYEIGCNAYAEKPIEIYKLFKILMQIGAIDEIPADSSLL